jgi:hypothetical protein
VAPGDGVVERRDIGDELARFAAEPIEDRQLFGAARIRDEFLDEEAVHLG